MARFVWNPRAFAALAAAKLSVFSVETMPQDRIVMETCEAEGAQPLIVIASHPYAMHRAKGEAFKFWGPEAAECLESRMGTAPAYAWRGDREIVIPVMKMTYHLEDSPPPFAPMYTEWRVDLFRGGDPRP